MVSCFQALFGKKIRAKIRAFFAKIRGYFTIKKYSLCE